ncbi:MAG: bifunctional glutamate N-acetyltransferase/amino-acid acetyltransferase ArgJ [Thiotrichaceae bacterium]
MAVNLSPPEKLLPIAGIKLASVAAGIYKDRKDLVLVEIAEGSQVAAVFTKNAFCAAPVTLSKENLTEATPRYLLINAGNANAGTGVAGMQAAKNTCQFVAESTGSDANETLPFSTGVIGQALPVALFPSAISNAASQLAEDNWVDAANTIMTTDTVAKGISKQLDIGGKVVTITGITKGSGMIKPDMATMLAYVATDADINKNLLQQMLIEATDTSFNSITVDSDTSTNDSLILIATGQSEVKIDNQKRDCFQKVLNEVCQFLAQAIIRDAEGVTKFVTIDVIDALTVKEAKEVAYTVAHSPLVKTALFASDPNWGRILAAVGRSNVDALDVSKISLWLGDTLLLASGEPAASYTEEQGQQEMNKDEINIRIYLDRGEALTRIWTSDLSYDYVKINAEYRS